MRILDQGIVYDATSAPVHRRFCAFTNVTALSDGRILVAFHAGSGKEAPDENVLMRLSGTAAAPGRRCAMGSRP